MTMDRLHESGRDIPVCESCDICVIGGGCTGVFAAVAAARLGARVSLVEAHGFFGGVAAAGLVNIWHTLLDETCSRQIIGGLTSETLERLARRDAVLLTRPGPTTHVHVGGEGPPPDPRLERVNHLLNTEELKITLDELVVEAGVRPFLHARFVATIAEGGRVAAAVIEDKSGRRAIRAAYFIDASGDGDLVARADLPHTRRDSLQPATACVRIAGLGRLLRAHRDFDLPTAVFGPQRAGTHRPGFLWAAAVVGNDNDLMVAGTRIPVDGSNADELTRAEIEGRRQVRAVLDSIQRSAPGENKLSLSALPVALGLRESRKARCLHTVTGQELLNGQPFEDAVANGTYPVDLHFPDRPGIVWRHLDGTETYFPPTGPAVHGRWRPPRRQDPTFYQIPYRSLVPQGAANVLAAGRIIDTDAEAFGGTRVMVNCNQVGQAAGTAAWLALDGGRDVADIDTAALRRLLARNGAIVIEGTQTERHDP